MTAIFVKGDRVSLKRGVPSIPVTDLLALAGVGEVAAVIHLDGVTTYNVLVERRGEERRRILCHVPADLLEHAPPMTKEEP